MSVKPKLFQGNYSQKTDNYPYKLSDFRLMKQIITEIWHKCKKKWLKATKRYRNYRRNYHYRNQEETTWSQQEKEQVV